MSNLLFAGDFHITEQDIPEINAIFQELLILKDKHSVSKLLITGDTFDKVNPTPKEIDCFASFIKAINIQVILLAASSHESISNTESILNHFGILNNNIKVVKEYQDDNYLFMGHFALKESKTSYGATKTKAEFASFKYVILGHVHSFELIKPNVCQLGSIRYVDFAEVKDEKKVCLLLENYKEKTEMCHFLALNSPFAMKEVSMGSKAVNSLPGLPGKKSEEEIRAYMDNLPKNTKVRVIFTDFESFKAFLPFYHVYKEKFVVFKDKKDFDVLVQALEQKKEQIDVKSSLREYLEANKVNEDIKKILLEEIK